MHLKWRVQGKVSSFQLTCSGLGEDGLVGETLGVDGLGANQASAMVMVRLLDGRQYQQVLNAEQPAFLVPAESSSGEVMSDYTYLGMEHIWGGIDHLLFVFGLLLLVGGGSRLLWTITAFTLGHSITLSLVTLGFFDYPVALVEFTIAVSIFVLAVELTRKERNDVLWRNPWWLAGGVRGCCMEWVLLAHWQRRVCRRTTSRCHCCSLMSVLK